MNNKKILSSKIIDQVCLNQKTIEKECNFLNVPSSLSVKESYDDLINMNDIGMVEELLDDSSFDCNEMNMGIFDDDKEMKDLFNVKCSTDSEQKKDVTFENEDNDKIHESSSTISSSQIIEGNSDCFVGHVKNDCNQIRVMQGTKLVV